jgi:hypothetical protein
MNIRMSFALLAGIGLGHSAVANTIHVCPTCAHTSIQAAVNDAVSGDLVSIAAGRYTENIIIEGKQLTLQGATGGTSGVTEVFAAGQGPVFALGSGIAGTTPELIEMHNLVIAQGNHFGGTGVGGGVQVRAGAYLHLYDSTVTQNLALNGGGIGVNSPGAPPTLISGCLIDDNQSGLLEPNGFVGHSGGNGGGVDVVAGSGLSIQASTITHNASFEGGGVYSDAGTQLRITDSIISSNTAEGVGGHLGPAGGEGGGLNASGSLTITGSSFVSNLADPVNGDGGGLTVNLNPGDAHVISNTIIAQNGFINDLGVKGTGGGIAAFGSGISPPFPVLTLNSVYVVENSAPPSQVGGISADDVTLSLSNTTVKDNTGP